MGHMPNLKQVIDVLETLYPLRYAEEWDEPGLIVGDLSHDVHRIVFAADPTSAIIDKAIATGADLLITHHPLFFRSVHETSGLGFRGDIVRRLYQHGCGLWVGHTNADAAYRGVGQAAADYFGLIDQKPLVPIDDANASHPVGLGRVGRLPKPVALKDFAQRVFDEVSDHGMTSALGIQVCGDSDTFVQYVAILPGSGDSLFNEVQDSILNADEQRLIEDVTEYLDRIAQKGLEKERTIDSLRRENRESKELRELLRDPEIPDLP